MTKPGDTVGNLKNLVYQSQSPIRETCLLLVNFWAQVGLLCEKVFLSVSLLLVFRLCNSRDLLILQHFFRALGLSGSAEVTFQVRAMDVQNI